MNDAEAKMAAALQPFGWTCGPEFWRRYYTDTWVFNLANAVERLSVNQLSDADRAVLDAANDEADAEEAYLSAGWDDEQKRRITFEAWREKIDKRRAAVRARREAQS
jgi:hypothetical protein